MAFTNNFRIERVYFERLKTLIEVLKSYKDNITEEPARTMIENAIDVDGAVLLLYRNLGEAWAELADLIQKTQKLLQDLDDKTEAYHDELNERIDEVNNYLMALIRALEARVDAIEADLQQMGRLYTYDLNRVNDEYTLSESGTPVTFDSTTALFSHTRPHLVTVRGNVNGETLYFFPREYDSDMTDGLYEWYTFSFVGNEIHEITVTLLPDDSVNVAVKTTNFTSIVSRISNLELSVADLLQRMTNAEEDIDVLEQTAENLEQNKQNKLIAGSGISIDPDTGVIENTAQGATYTADRGIEITSNNVIRSTASVIAAPDFSVLVSSLPFNSTNFTFSTPDEYETANEKYYSIIGTAKDTTLASAVNAVKTITTRCTIPDIISSLPTGFTQNEICHVNIFIALEYRRGSSTAFTKNGIMLSGAILAEYDLANLKIAMHSLLKNRRDISFITYDAKNGAAYFDKFVVQVELTGDKNIVDYVKNHLDSFSFIISGKGN